MPGGPGGGPQHWHELLVTRVAGHPPGCARVAALLRTADRGRRWSGVHTVGNPLGGIRCELRYVILCTVGKRRVRGLRGRVALAVALAGGGAMAGRA